MKVWTVIEKEDGSCVVFDSTASTHGMVPAKDRMEAGLRVIGMSAREAAFVQLAKRLLEYEVDLEPLLVRARDSSGLVEDKL